MVYQQSLIKTNMKTQTIMQLSVQQKYARTNRDLQEEWVKIPTSNRMTPF